MSESPRVDAECVIVMLDSNLEDNGEITRFTSWQHTLKLNEVSSWELALRTKDFDSYGIDENTHFCFYRDGDLLIDGPIMQNGIQRTLSAGVETTKIIGGCDNAYLASRICYPVVTGPLFDVNTGNWRFGVQRSAIGIQSSITMGCDAGEEFDIPLIVDNAEGFLDGSTVRWVTAAGTAYEDWHDIPGGTAAYGSCKLTLAGVDFSTNTLTIANPQGSAPGDCGYDADVGQILAPEFPAGGRIYQTSGGIVDDPLYIGYDTRTGLADDIAKQLVYFNAGRGACSDHFGTRSIPYLEMGLPNAQGVEVTANSRGENLLTQIQNVCLSGGVFFKTTLVGQELVFDTFIGDDLSQDANLLFSIEMGNLKDYVYTYGPPVGNMVWGLGPETGPDKLMLPSGSQTSIDQFGRWETWVSATTANAGDSPAQIAANMVQSNNLALASTSMNGNLTFTIQETDQVQYPRDFKLGDRIGILIGKLQVNEIVSAVSYVYPSSGSAAGAGSALIGAFTQQETGQMKAIKGQKTLLQQMNMT
jgi:hypothetical protein